MLKLDPIYAHRTGVITAPTSIRLYFCVTSSPLKGYEIKEIRHRCTDPIDSDVSLLLSFYFNRSLYRCWELEILLLLLPPKSTPKELRDLTYIIQKVVNQFPLRTLTPLQPSRNVTNTSSYQFVRRLERKHFM